MKTLHRLACLAFLASACAGALHAQAPTGVAPPARLKAAELADGEVRKIDKARGTVTLKHGEIKSIGMAPMAMEFEVKDRAALDKLKVGDKLKFNASYEGGKYYVTDIQPAK
jgi:Cu(I)/Ag(I) efflux system protein CusF